MSKTDRFHRRKTSFFIARSALQTLSNPKTSLIRKRQMMQQLFGDYRHKMHEEDLARQKRLLFIFISFEILFSHPQVIVKSKPATTVKFH